MKKKSYVKHDNKRKTTSAKTRKSKPVGFSPKKKSTYKPKNEKQAVESKGKRQFSTFNKMRIGEEIEGTIEGTGKSFAFFEPLDKSGDMFIGEDDLGGAIHGDRVLVRKISQQRGNGEAKVIKILERVNSEFTAVVENKYALPLLKGMPKSIAIITDGSAEFASGDTVVCKMVDDKPIFCHVTENLGKTGETDTDIKAIMRSYKLKEDFPINVVKEANSLDERVTVGTRADYREDLVITVDGDSSKDFDDAICVKKSQEGYTLYVHIADVSHYVRENSALDKEALRRGTSVYFADRVVPMLPERLSNGVCSLNEGVDRYTLSVTIIYDKEGNVVGKKIAKGVIRSKARMTYNKVAKILDGDEELRKQYAFLVEMLENAKELADILSGKRKERGSIDFDIAETEFVFDEHKNVVDLKKAERLSSHIMIEEFMLAANEIVAKSFATRKVPFVYRVHETPPPEKIESLNEFLYTIGVQFVDEPSASDYANLVESVDDSVKNVVSRVALRSMSKACYKPTCDGHFGLALKYYTHFTSPIRRYPDLMIHRIIKSFLVMEDVSKYKDKVENVSRISSERENVADEAERAVDDLLKAKYMADKIGNEYIGTVSGVTERGIFVELDNAVEGMIRVENMNGYFTFNEKAMALVSGQKTYRLGDSIKIKVDGIAYDKIAFTVVE